METTEYTLKKSVSFGAGKWFLFAILNLFTYGLSSIGYIIYGLSLRSRNWVVNDNRKTLAPQCILDLYKTSGNTIITAGVIAFIASVICVACFNTSWFGMMVMLCFVAIIALPVWGHGRIKYAIEKTSALQIEFEKEKQKADEEAELDRKALALYENMPVVPRYPEGFSNQEFRSVIAGIGHQFNYYGGFAGYIVPEPNNPYDENAMAIYILDKRIGYIPKRDNIHYKDWCNNQPMPCVGCIYYDDRGKKVGVIRAIRYTNDEALREISNDFFDWFRSNGMPNLVPDHLFFGVKIESETEGGEEEML